MFCLISTHCGFLDNLLMNYYPETFSCSNMTFFSVLRNQTRVSCSLTGTLLSYILSARIWHDSSKKRFFIEIYIKCGLDLLLRNNFHLLVIHFLSKIVDIVLFYLYLFSFSCLFKYNAVIKITSVFLWLNKWCFFQKHFIATLSRTQDVV